MKDLLNLDPIFFVATILIIFGALFISYFGYGFLLTVLYNRSLTKKLEVYEELENEFVQKIKDIEKISIEIQSLDDSEPWPEGTDYFSVIGYKKFHSGGNILIIDRVNTSIWMKIARNGNVVPDSTVLPLDLDILSYKNKFVTIKNKECSYKTTWIKIETKEIPEKITLEYVSEMLGFPIGRLIEE